MGYSSSQKSAIANFINLTGAKEQIAGRFLKANAWKLDQAADDYYQNGQSSSLQPTINAVNKIFDQYRDDAQNNPDEIGINGAMKYLNDIQVKLDEVACLAVAELLQSPSMGEFTREKFVEGWKTLNCDTLQKQASFANTLRHRLTTDSQLFRQVYRYTFLLCRMPGQRNVNLDIATEQWRLFFSTERGGVSWETKNVPWLEWWIEFAETKHTRPINKDLWEQLEVLMRKTLEDETMSWWSSDAAWPGAIDEFIGFVKEKQAGDGKGDAMEVE
ncbi:Scaffold-type E3 ligase [Myotisia sp. PD_48]|nr:Scaffold-type E3 ligase [Myotisia sp. PD_48]